MTGSRRLSSLEEGRVACGGRGIRGENKRHRFMNLWEATILIKAKTCSWGANRKNSRSGAILVFR